MTKLLITGSRGITDQEVFNEALNIVEGHIELIIHGGARGVDTLAERYAEDNDIESKIVRPVNPKNAQSYLYRNVEMIAMCDEVLAVWDGDSTGTLFTINYAKARGKEVSIYEVTK